MVVVVVVAVYLSIHLSIYLSVYLSVYLSICKLENEAILRDFLKFWTWQHQKRSNFARLPQFLHLTTSKTKQFCETSYFLSWKVECRADGLVPMRFAICPVHLSKLLRLPRKSDARSYEVLHLSRKIISANLKIWGSKMQPFSGNQRPPTALMNMSLVLHLPRKMQLCRSSSNVPRFHRFLDMLENLLLTFGRVQNPLHLPRKTTLQRPKAARTCGVLYILTSKCALRHNDVHFCFWTSQFPKVLWMWCVLYSLTWQCASRHNGVHFSNISTSKSAPNPLVFNTFWLGNAPPQRRALFRHHNFQNIWKPASRHNGVQFFISHLATWLRTPTNHWKNAMFCDFATFSRTCIFSLLLFSSLTLPTSAFPFVHIVGSLTSKLPSINYCFKRSKSPSGALSWKPRSSR